MEKLSKTETERIIKMTSTLGWKALKKFYQIQKRVTFKALFNLDENDPEQRKIITQKKKEFKAIETLIYDIEGMTHREEARIKFEKDQEEVFKEILPKGYEDFSLDGEYSGQDDADE